MGDKALAEELKSIFTALAVPDKQVQVNTLTFDPYYRLGCH